MDETDVSNGKPLFYWSLHYISGISFQQLRNLGSFTASPIKVHEAHFMMSIFILCSVFKNMADGESGSTRLSTLSGPETGNVLRRAMRNSTFAVNPRATLAALGLLCISYRVPVSHKLREKEPESRRYACHTFMAYKTIKPSGFDIHHMDLVESRDLHRTAK